MNNKPSKPFHPAIPDLHSDWRRGKMSRRQFLRLATLLGASATTAALLAGCGVSPMPEIGTEAVASSPTYGGVMRIGTAVQPIDHPARLAWAEAANQLRHVAEYLTETGSDNVTRPLLLESWEADRDVQTWTLNLRQGITFSNGQPLTADDVIFNFEQWLDPDVGSSMLGLLTYLSPNNVEKVDDFTVKLHLDIPQIGVPEHLFHYPALIVPRDFEGDFLTQPIGTGPFTLEAYRVGNRVQLKRRDSYWRQDEMGNALPYLDELIYLDLSPDERVAALQAGLIDTLFVPRPEDWQALQTTPNLKILNTPTAQTFVLRMRTDQTPWTDERVRLALKLCQNRQTILDSTYFGQGDLAHDAHVAPVHPAYCERPIPDYDPERARALLEEAGYREGLNVTLTTKNDQGEPELARAIKELAAPGGFNITLNIVEPNTYWSQWTEVNLGITTWAHRPLDTMTLSLAYTVNPSGSPAPWNETHWVDAEFITELRRAERTLDILQRRNIMCKLQEIMQDRGPIGISYWRNGWTIIHDSFHNVAAHPTGYDLFYNVWKAS